MYTPGNPVSHFKMSDSLTETGLIYILFDTLVYCLEAWILSLWSKSLCTTFVSLKNKIWLDKIKTSFLISSNRKRAYGCEWSGEFAPKITLTWLDKALLHPFSLCVSFLTTVCTSECTNMYVLICCVLIRFRKRRAAGQTWGKWNRFVWKSK